MMGLFLMIPKAESDRRVVRSYTGDSKSTPKGTEKEIENE